MVKVPRLSLIFPTKILLFYKGTLFSTSCDSSSLGCFTSNSDKLNPEIIRNIFYLNGNMHIHLQQWQHKKLCLQKKSDRYGSKWENCQVKSEDIHSILKLEVPRKCRFQNTLNMTKFPLKDEKQAIYATKLVPECLSSNVSYEQLHTLLTINYYYKCIFNVLLLISGPLNCKNCYCEIEAFVEKG